MARIPRDWPCVIQPNAKGRRRAIARVARGIACWCPASPCRESRSEDAHRVKPEMMRLRPRLAQQRQLENMNLPTAVSDAPDAITRSRSEPKASEVGNPEAGRAGGASDRISSTDTPDTNEM